MNKKPIQVAQNAVDFLSALSEDQIKRMGIQDKVVVVSWARRVIGKYRMMENVQAKIDIINHRFKEVISLFNPLINKGIPFFWEEKGPLLNQGEYLEKFVLRRYDHRKFEDMQHTLSGPVVFDKLVGEFETLFDFKIACTKVPNLTCLDNMELRVLAHDMIITYFSGSEQWKSIQMYGSNKFKLHS